MSPITHMDRTEGNEALLARQEIITPAGKRAIPKLSGNALRHRMIRAPLARHLVEACDLAGKLTMRQLNFLFHGGTLTDSSARQDTAGWAKARELLPMLRLLGGSLPDAILPGSLIVDAGWLVCRENHPRVQSRCPAGVDVPVNLRSAEDFVGGYQYTRSDAAKSAADLVARDAGADNSLMIISGQTVLPGAVFVHELIANHISDLEIGAMLLGLALWQQSGGTIGGQASRGHGRLQTDIVLPDDIDAGGLVEDYDAHVRANADDIGAWLTAAFATKAEKPTKGKKKGAKDATPEGDGALV